MSSAELVQAYRSLYRAGLRAVRFSKPARYVVRDQLRDAFRATTLAAVPRHMMQEPPSFDAAAVGRTVSFLEAAGASRDLEHRVVRNMVRAAYWRRRRAKSSRLTWKAVLQQKEQKEQQGQEQRGKKPSEKKDEYRYYDSTIRMINKTLGTCLR